MLLGNLSFVEGPFLQDTGISFLCVSDPLSQGTSNSSSPWEGRVRGANKFHRLLCETSDFALLCSLQILCAIFVHSLASSWSHLTACGFNTCVSVGSVTRGNEMVWTKSWDTCLSAQISHFLAKLASVSLWYKLTARFNLPALIT